MKMSAFFTLLLLLFAILTRSTRAHFRTHALTHTHIAELVQSTKGRGKSASQGQLQEIQEAITELETVKGVNGTQL
jgi:hypothetical protein